MRSILVSITLGLAVVAGIGLHGAIDHVDRTFPGFLVLDNGVIASAGLSDWPAVRDGSIYQHRILTVDGVPVAAGPEVGERIRALPPGTGVEYLLQGPSSARTRTIYTRSFGWRDFLMLYGAYLVNGLLLAVAGLSLLQLGRRESARAVTPLLLIASLWGLSAMDLYGPYHLFRVHALAESLLFAAALHMALAFPQPFAWARRAPKLIYLPYAAAALLAVAYQIGLQRPGYYVTLHLLAVGALGASLLFLVGSQLARLAKGGARHPAVRVLAAGSVLALAPAVLLTIAEPVNGGTSPANAIAFTAFLLPLSVAFAAARSRRAARLAGTRASLAD